MCFAIVGGGVAAAQAAVAIRERDGEILVPTEEWLPPYQRPPLSKEFLPGRAALADVLVRPGGCYTRHNVTLHVDVHVDAATRSWWESA